MGTFDICEKNVYSYDRLFSVIHFNLMLIPYGTLPKIPSKIIEERSVIIFQIHVRLGDFDKKSDNGVEFLVQGTAKVNYN